MAFKEGCHEKKGVYTKDFYYCYLQSDKFEWVYLKERLSRRIDAVISSSVPFLLRGAKRLVRIDHLWPLMEKVPDSLNPREYYELGVVYRLTGWIELAKDCLYRAETMANGDEVAVHAERLRRTELPRMEVPNAAVEGNIEGFNLMRTEPDKAKKVFERLMETYPDFEWPFTNLAKIYIREGNTEKARGLARYAHSVNAQLLRPIELMAHIELEEENDKQALSHFEELLKLSPLNFEYLIALLQLRNAVLNWPPDNPPDSYGALDYYEIGYWYLANQRYALSKKNFEKAIELAGPDENYVKVDAERLIKTQLPKVDLPEHAEKRFSLCCDQFEKDEEKATRELKELTEEFPDFERAQVLLATLEKAHGNGDKAEELIESVLSENPDFMPAIEMAYYFALTRNDLKLALQHIEHGISLNPFNTDFIYAKMALARKLYEASTA